MTEARQRRRPAQSSSIEQREGGETVSTEQRPESPDMEFGAMMSRQGFVIVKGGITQNMGNYNSVRVDVAVGLPCAPTRGDLESTYSMLSETVESLLQNELDRAMGHGATA